VDWYGSYPIYLDVCEGGFFFWDDASSTLLSLKVDVQLKNCAWYKIMTMTFWRDWRLPTPLNPKYIVS
jgi:hypothetical protein